MVEFLVFLITTKSKKKKKHKNFDICIKQKSAYNRSHTVTMHHKVLLKGA